MGRWLEAAKRYSDPPTKPTFPTKLAKSECPVTRQQVLSEKSVLSVPLETDFEERAALVKYGAAVPREWAEGYATLFCMERPEGIAQKRWQQILDDGGYFLDRWAKRNPDKRIIHVIWDNAAYHKGPDVRAFLARPACRINLIQLPPYCPHLNPIERLWAVLHRHVTHNRYYRSQKLFADAIRAICEGLR